MNINLVLLACSATLLFSGCSKQINSLTKKRDSNLVTLASGIEKTIVDDGTVKYKFLNTQGKITSGLGISPLSLKGKQILNALPEKALSKADDEIKAKSATKEVSLLVAIPIAALGEQNLFGGVITKVSDKNNSELGGLKLTDLTPIHVRPFVAGVAQGNPSMVLVGCTKDCNEDSDKDGLIAFPIVGILEAEKMIVVDLSAVGKELDLVTMMDPDGDYTGLKPISSATTAMDYSVSTLVFDVTTKMIAKDKEVTDATAPVTEFVVRWYLRSNAISDVSFDSRTPTEGVGFFTTSRSEVTKITRFSKDGVKYFIKNVPTEHRPAFKAALDAWNVKFKSVIGRNLIAYEFVEASDPRHAELVAGDIRYNIIEWDLENKAGYGGLGPSIANQFTGETLSGNILIQGPTIIELYSEWFKTSKAADALLLQGLAQDAHDLLIAFNNKTEKMLERRNSKKFAVKLGKKLELTVNSQRPELEDPMSKGSFDAIPAGQTYETYMAGYFHEMLAHEMGHNLGLRHNFLGNVGDDGSRNEGSTSRSIMEYLGRNYRYLNRISDYDVMAIGYGYKGTKPDHLNWFCTDEDVAYEDSDLVKVNAECTKDDATNDPFSYFQSMLVRSVDLIIAPKTTAAPLWKTAELKAKIDTAVKGLSSYALSAEATAKSWTNFFGKDGRPQDASGVKDYVILKVKEQLCDKKIIEAINSKESEEGRALAEANMQSFTKLITSNMVRVNAADELALKCD